MPQKVNDFSKKYKTLLRYLRSSLHASYNRKEQTLLSIMVVFSVTLGLIMLSWLIYARFLRPRLPKNIPFNLVEFRFYILLYICCIYGYIIKSLLFPKKIVPLVKKIKDFFYRPLVELNNFAKYFLIIKFLQTRFETYLLSKIEYYNYTYAMTLIIIYQIVPKVVILLIFLVDVFWLNMLSAVYYFVWLNIFPLGYRYYKYTVKNIKENYLSCLKECYFLVWLYEEKSKEEYRFDPLILYHDKSFTLEEYIDVHRNILKINYENKTNFIYEVNPFPSVEHVAKYAKENNKDKNNLSKEDDENLDEEFHDAMQNILALDTYLIILTTASENKLLIRAKVIIYSFYLLAWSYILIKSTHTIIDMPITLKILTGLIKYLSYNNPFIT